MAYVLPEQDPWMDEQGWHRNGTYLSLIETIFFLFKLGPSIWLNLISKPPNLVKATSVAYS